MFDKVGPCVKGTGQNPDGRCGYLLYWNDKSSANPTTTYVVNGFASEWIMSMFAAMGKGKKMIGKSVKLPMDENWLFWITWLSMTVLMNIIMLKFVIAEIKGVYKKIDTKLKENVLRDRAGLCAEVDIMRPNIFKSDNSYPKYFIVREIST